MIVNESQHQITKEWAERFEKAIAEIQTKPDKRLCSWMQEVELAAMRGQLDDLKAEINAYENKVEAKTELVEAPK